MKQRRIFSSAEFDRAAGSCRLTPESIDLARQVLVRGKRQSEVAREADASRQQISEIVRKMRMYIEHANPVPEGWKSDLVTLPLADWPRVREIERQARAALDKAPKRRKGRA